MSEVNQSLGIVQNSYPEMAKLLRLFWGHAEFSELMQGFLYGTCGHTPEVFSLAVITALLALQHCHDFHYPQFSIHAKSRCEENSRPAEYA